MSIHKTRGLINLLHDATFALSYSCLTTFWFISFINPLSFITISLIPLTKFMLSFGHAVAVRKGRVFCNGLGKKGEQVSKVLWLDPQGKHILVLGWIRCCWTPGCSPSSYSSSRRGYPTSLYLLPPRAVVYFPLGRSWFSILASSVPSA